MGGGGVGRRGALQHALRRELLPAYLTYSGSLWSPQDGRRLEGHVEDALALPLGSGVATLMMRKTQLEKKFKRYATLILLANWLAQ